MAAVSYAEFLPEVLHLCAGVPEPTAINAIRNACIDFCNTSLVWVETADAVSVTSTSFPYAVETPAGANTASVLGVSLDGLLVTPKSQDWLDREVQNWRSITSAPRYFYQPDPNNLVIVPLPSISYSMIVRTAFKPTRASTGVEEYVYQNYLEPIAARALEKLLSIPDQAWSDASLGTFFGQKYASGVKDATGDANKSFTRQSLRVTMSPMA